MAKFFKENKKMLLLFLAIAIIFPIMILFPSPVGIIPYEIGLTIVGYGGSILGGFLTLYGVWWTIEDNNKQRKEDKKIEYLPILRIEQDEKESELKNHILTLAFSLLNFGRGEAQDVNLDFETKMIARDNTTTNINAYQIVKDNLSLIIKNEYKRFYISYIVPKEMTFPTIFTVQFTIEYYDLFQDKKYCYKQNKSYSIDSKQIANAIELSVKIDDDLNIGTIEIVQEMKN